MAGRISELGPAAAIADAHTSEVVQGGVNKQYSWAQVKTFVKAFFSANLDTFVVPAGTTISTFGASLIDDAAASNARSTLGLAIGSDVQAHDTALDNVTGTNTGDEVTATNSTEGVLEIMTLAEFRSKTANKMVTPDTVYDAAAEVTLTSTTNLIALNLDSGINFTIVLDENNTLSNATNLDVGQSGYIRFVQDDTTGSRTMAYGTSYEFAGGSAFTLSTAVDAEDIVFYTVIAAGRILLSPVLDIS